MKHFFLSICIAGSAVLFAQQTERIEITFSSGPETFLFSSATAQADEQEWFGGKYFRYITFNTIPAPEQTNAMRAEGIELLYFIEGKTYQAAISKPWDANWNSRYGIKGAFPISATSKMHYELSSGLSSHQWPGHAIQADGSIGITFTAYSVLPHFDVLDTLYRRGYQVTYHNEHSHRFTVFCAEQQIPALVALPFVCAAEILDAPPVPDNNVGRTNHRNNWLAQEFPGGNQYNGQGVNVMLQDDGIIGPHIDYQGRLIDQFITYNNGDHGDHCAGIIMGAGNKDPLTRGMGWGANLYVYRAAPYQGFDSIYDHYYTKDIVITSTSYSDGCNAGYTSLAQELDQQINDMPSLIHVFSGGNNGTADCSYGAGAGWGNITGGHKHSKNSIAVGNLDYIDVIAGSSSRGPVHDGRMKPEVCAVGTNVYSTIDVNNYDYKTGTSMSCPAVSGTFSALYQAYKEMNGNVNPPSGLMKAVMMNTADDLGNPGPDFTYGYGRINGRRALEPIQQNQYTIDSVATSQSNTHTITVPAGTGRIKVMVYWHDHAAAINANVALVNNLDMTMTAPNAATFQPWILDYTANATNLSANAVPGTDIRNNHEQITIDNPTPGVYTVTINGTTVPFGPQTYYLVWSFEPVDELVLTYPNGGEGFVPNEQQTIRWDALGNTGTFALEYSLDSGATWVSMNPSVPANVRYYNWSVPSAFTGKALVSIKRGAAFDTSDHVFNIARTPANISFPWTCPDSLLIRWDTVPGAISYDIFMLGNVYMDSIGSTATDSFIVRNLNNITNTYWFSVRANGPQNAVGRRAIAVEKQPGVFCPGTYDASVNSVASPGGVYFDCMNTQSIPVTIELSNPGPTTITNVPVFYSLNNATPVSDLFTGSITTGGSVNFTFSTPLTISSPGNNTLDVWAVYPNDIVPGNDTFRYNISYSTGTYVTPPYSQDFETFALCGTASNCEADVCNLGAGWKNAQNVTQDDIDWRTDDGGTPSTGTGPTSLDYRPGSATGNYLYIEASGTCAFKTAELYSPCIDLTTYPNPVLTFGYHMYGVDMGELHVDIFSNGSWTNDVFFLSGSQGNQWREAVVSLTAYQGQIIIIRFRGVTGGGYLSDLAIDGIRIDDLSSVEEQPTVSTSIYPNPGNGLYTVNIQGLDKQQYTLSVYDITGRLVTSTQHNSTDGNSQVTVDLTSFESGTYILELQSGDQKYNFELIKTDE